MSLPPRQFWSIGAVGILTDIDADYYLVEFGNEALKLAAAQRASKQSDGHANGNGNGHANGHGNTNGH